MSIGEVTKEILGRKVKVLWKQRDSRSVPEVARERIQQYFSNCSVYNTLSIFIRYETSVKDLGLWTRLHGRKPIFEEWVFQRERGSDKIEVIRWNSRKEGKATVNLADYLNGARCVSLNFMFGSHYNGNCVIEWDEGLSRIGKLQEELREEDNEVFF